MLTERFIKQLRLYPFDEPIDYNSLSMPLIDPYISKTQLIIADLLEQLLSPVNVIDITLKEANKMKQIMEVSQSQIIQNFFSLLISSVKNCLNNDFEHIDFTLQKAHVEKFIVRSFYVNLNWSVSAGLCESNRLNISKTILLHRGVTDLLLEDDKQLIDYDVDLLTGNFVPWNRRVPSVDIESHALDEADSVIPTIDTLRHEKLIYSWLSERRPVILCGPPGSGKVWPL